MRTALLLATLVCAAAPAVIAAPVHVHLTSHEPKPERVKLTFTSSADARSLTVAGADVQLGAGHWCVSATSADAWSPNRCFDVAAGARTEVALDVWPSGVIRGAVSVESQKPEPAAISIRFEGRTSDGANVDGSVECPVAAATHAFRCSVPAGTLDIRVHARRYVSIYRFGVVVASDKPHDLGALHMVEGSSVTGKVEAPRELRKLSDITVTVRNSSIHAGNGPMLPGMRLLPESAPVERNGWFHVDGLLPGEYSVVAKGPNLLRSNEYQVTVRSDTETELRDVLRLEQPHKVILRVEPPVAPNGAQWHVSVLRELSIGRADVIAQSLTARNGIWNSPLLQPGRYEIQIGDFDEGSVWATERVDISSRDEERTLSVTPRRVTGTLHLGDRPLQATLIFSDVRHRSLATTSDHDGHFSLALPADAQSWDVLIRRDAPSIVRSVRDVPIGADGTLDLRIAASVLSGVVEEEAGRGVGALVTINRTTTSDAPVQQLSTHADGTFEAVGLTDGDYVLSAEGEHGRSDPQSISFRESEQASVRLTIRKARQLRGRVISDLGPVAGATVTVVPTDLPVGMMTSVMSDANGMFTSDLPSGAREANIFTAAPGFAYTLDHIDVRDELLAVRVRQSGGTLTLRGPSGKPFVLRHGPVSVSPTLLTAQWTATATLHSDVMTVVAPMMDPGSYALCGSDGRCSWGVLDPYGSLTLAVP